MAIKKSPLAPLFQRGVTPHLGKLKLGGILQPNIVIIMRLLIPIFVYIVKSPGGVLADILLF